MVKESLKVGDGVTARIAYSIYEPFTVIRTTENSVTLQADATNNQYLSAPSVMTCKDSDITRDPNGEIIICRYDEKSGQYRNKAKQVCYIRPGRYFELDTCD